MSTWAALLLTLSQFPPRSAGDAPSAHAAPSAREASSTGRLVAECAGCHGAQRSKPRARFSFGVGQWGEAQCYGCHEELADMGKSLLRKQGDNRVFGLPYSLESMKRFAFAKGPFLKAPAEPEWNVGTVERIDVARLPEFLAHPPVRSDGASMIPFPSFGRMAAADVSARGAGAPHAVVPSGVSEGKEIFESKCAACHATSEGPAQKGPVHLALHTARWLVAYANGEEPPGGKRAMPRVPLSMGEGETLVRFFEWNRRERVRGVDAAFARLRVEGTHAAEASRELRAVRVVSNASSSGSVSFSVASLLREGRCVHCHDGDHRAAKVFQASPEGVVRYLESEGARPLLARLAVRKVEVSLGVVGTSPGMPASVEPLEEAVIAKFAEWIAGECARPQRNRVCAKAGTEEKTVSK